MSIASLDIELEDDVIHIYTGDHMIPSETFTLQGHVVLATQRTVTVRQITVHLRGTVNNLISGEVIRQDEPVPETEDVDHWPIAALHNSSSSRSLSLKNRVARSALNSALGLTSSTYILIDVTLNLFESAISLPPGTHRFAFKMDAPQPRSVAPSIILPRHSIHYELSARLQMASVVDTVTHMVKKRNRNLSTVVPITIYCHMFGNRTLLQSQPRVRYRGCRKTMIRYEVALAKYISMEDGILDLVCLFQLLQAKAAVSFVQVCLDQVIVFPLRGGRLTGDCMESDVYVTKTHRIADASFPVNIEIDLPTELHFNLDIRSRFLIPDLDTVLLTGTHKVRLTVHFTDPQVRNMSLSFPIVIGTVPTDGDTVLQMPTLLAQPPAQTWDHREEEDDWIEFIASSYMVRPVESLDGAVHIRDTLPTYLDVLHEGSPPSAFSEHPHSRRHLHRSFSTGQPQVLSQFST